MKRILFVINALDGGGAEKSLVSLLNELEPYQNQFKIDLLLPNKEGLFSDLVPSFVNQIPVPEALTYMAYGFKYLIKNKKWNLRYTAVKIRWVFKRRKLKSVSSGVLEQELWRLWEKHVSGLDSQYDSAISYLNGYGNYYVIDKVSATKKCLWIHNEYQKLGYHVEFDRRYYEEADEVITISDLCKKSFTDVYPELQDKIKVLENISSGRMIKTMAQQHPQEDSFSRYHGTRLLSIGRLVEQKNFSLAVRTAAYMKSHYPEVLFKWFIIGKGPEYASLTEQIQKENLSDVIELIGVRKNPYSYMKQADLIVQTSIFEGKSIVLDEAKILGKTIVATNYPTVYNSIENGATGLIADMNPESIADSVVQILSDVDLQSVLEKNLHEFAEGNIKELEKYLDIMF